MDQLAACVLAALLALSLEPPMPTHLDEADRVRDDVIRDLRARLTRAHALIGVAALAGILGGAAVAPYLGALLP